MQNGIIELNGVSKSFSAGGQTIKVLDNIDLSIKQNDFFGVIGPSGSGKSTLLHLVSGLVMPEKGIVTVFNEDLNKLSDLQISALRNQKIGMIFQDFHLFEHLTVRENIEIPLLIKYRSLDKNLNNKVSKMLEELGLANRANHRPTEISGGQKQRTAIGRALINDPQILLADEPTGNLDSATGKEMIELIKQIHDKNGITTIIVTHDSHIADYCDKLIEINDMKLITRPHTKLYTE